MKLHLSKNTMRHVGVRRCRYSVLGGWSDAILVYAYFFEFAVTYGKATNKAYN
jgi:hypothetical protein